MPYIWTEPALVLEYQGVSIYNVYKDDNWERAYDYQYTTDITEQSTPFDIRDLESFHAGKDHKSILKRAIERGEITSPNEEVQSDVEAVLR